MANADGDRLAGQFGKNETWQANVACRCGSNNSDAIGSGCDQREESALQSQEPKQQASRRGNALRLRGDGSNPSGKGLPIAEHEWELQGPAPECSWWEVEPPVGRVVDGMAYRVEQLRSLGNGQVPRVVVEAWRRLVARISESQKGGKDHGG